MAKQRSKRPKPSAPPEELTVVVCRGGDCGSRRKHPDVDHGAQLTAFRDGTAGSARVIPSKCLDACEHSNVVVVLPSEAGSSVGATPVWIGEVNDTAVTNDIVEWVNAGGPGVAPDPTLVSVQEFRPTRPSRSELQPGHALP